MADHPINAWTVFCSRPDAESFAPLYEQTKGLVWTLCWRILRDEEAAHDAFQGVYARLLAEARRAAAVLSASRAADLPTNQIIYRLTLLEARRLQSQRRRRSRREVLMETPIDVADPHPDARTLAAQAEARSRLEVLVSTLPERLRLPLELHYFHGLNQTEIAEMMGKDKATISRRLARGLKRLEPLAARAGLGRATALLGGAGIVASLIQPPQVLAATVVFQAIQAPAFAALSAGGAWAGIKTLIGMSVTKPAIIACSVVTLLAAIVATQKISNTPNPPVVSLVRPQPSPFLLAASHSVLTTTPTQQTTPAAKAGLPTSTIETSTDVAATSSPLRGLLVDAETQSPIAEARVIVVAFRQGARGLNSVNWNEFDGAPLNPNLIILERLATSIDGSFTVGPKNSESTICIIPPGHVYRIILPGDRQKLMSGPQMIVPLAREGTLSGKLIIQGTPRADERLFLSRHLRDPKEMGSSTILVTASDGSYRFYNLPAGDYTMGWELQNGRIWGPGTDRTLHFEKGEQKTFNFGEDMGSGGLAGMISRDGQPLPHTHVELRSNAGPYTQFHAYSDDQGNYSFPSLPAGSYHAVFQLSMRVGVRGASEPFFRDDNVTVGLTLEHRDFAFSSGHLLTGRIVFSTPATAEFAPKMNGLTIWRTDYFSPTPPFTHPSDSLLEYYKNGSIEADGSGRISLLGQFRGDYRIYISLDLGNDARNYISLPGTHYLDTISSDQDLGDIALGPVGRVSFRLTMPPDAPSGPGNNFTAYLMRRADDPLDSEEIGLSLIDSEQVAGLVRAGDYTVVPYFPGYRTEPASLPLSVKPDTLVGPLQFTVKPDGVIFGSIFEFGIHPDRPITPRRITIIDASGVTRVIEPRDTNPDRMYLIGVEAAGSAYQIRGLPPGPCTLTVEAPGYETATLHSTIIPGRPALLQVPLMPAAGW